MLQGFGRRPRQPVTWGSTRRDRGHGRGGSSDITGSMAHELRTWIWGGGLLASLVGSRGGCLLI